MTKFIAAAKTQAGTNHPVNEDRLLLDGNVLCYGLVGDCECEMGCMAVFDGVSEGGHGRLDARRSGVCTDDSGFWSRFD